MQPSYHDLRQSSVQTVRAAIRQGAYQGHTAGLGGGHLQTNLVILPNSYALDFMRYCQRNPKPCPLVGVSETGDPTLPTLGRDLDVRTDLPSYNIYRHGRLERHVTSLDEFWNPDLVTFAIGCSFTFEHALLRAGIPVWHIARNTTVPMYRSSIRTVSAGPFGGDMVVSMRPIAENRIAETIAICKAFPLAHGSPVYCGDPATIGITDIAAPNWGDPVEIGDGEVPVFWACGVTPQIAIANAAVPLCITHTPGHMLISDVPEDAEFPILANQTMAAL